MQAARMGREVRGLHDGRGCPLRNRDVIGMSVGALRSESEDDMRSDSPYVGGDSGGRREWVHLVECAVGVIEKADLGDPQSGKLRGRSVPGPTVSPAFPARGGYQKYLDALAGIPGKGSTHPQGLVIGVSEDSHEPEVFAFGFVCGIHLEEVRVNWRRKVEERGGKWAGWI